MTIHKFTDIVLVKHPREPKFIGVIPYRPGRQCEVVRGVTAEWNQLSLTVDEDTFTALCIELPESVKSITLRPVPFPFSAMTDALAAGVLADLPYRNVA